MSKTARRAIWTVWASLTLVSLLIFLIVPHVTLHATRSNTPGEDWGSLSCGSINDIRGYAKHPTFRTPNDSPWSGVAGDGPSMPDVAFGQSCVEWAGVAQGVQVAAGVIVVPLLLLAVVIPIRRRRHARGVPSTKLDASTDDR